MGLGQMLAGESRRLNAYGSQRESNHNPAWRAVRIERLKWSNVLRHTVFATYTMRCSEEMRWPLQRPVQLPLTSEVQYGNRIDCSFGAVFARWRWLGLLALARLARLQEECRTIQPDPISRYFMRVRISRPNSRTLFQVPRTKSAHLRFFLLKVLRKAYPCIRMRSCTKFSNS